MGFTAAQLLAAKDKPLPDVLAPGLKVVFVGINPGLYSAATGHHFARPGNRFWPTLHLSGFTPRLFRPSEQMELLMLGIGLTNIVPRPSARADELTKPEILAGVQLLRNKITQYQPHHLAVLGVSVFRTAFESPKATLGPQPQTIGETRIHLMPNPSGLNAHYSLADLADLFAAFRRSLS